MFDTSVFIDHLRTGCHQQRTESVTGLIRTSPVVLAELWRSATKAEERKFLESLERNHPVLAPTENNWLESGRILGRIRAEKGFAPDKLRDLHSGVLIALTARSHGALLITSDRADFELMAPIESFHWRFGSPPPQQAATAPARRPSRGQALGGGKLHRGHHHH